MFALSGRRHIQSTEGKTESPVIWRETGKGKREAEHLQRCHVIEGMVQLLTNGLVLQLLSIQFIWRSEVDSRYRQVARREVRQTQAAKRQREREREREVEAKSKGRKEKTKDIGQVLAYMQKNVKTAHM